MNNTIDYQKFTKLPLEVLQKAELSSPIIQVTTPLGISIIELNKVDKGMFRKASEVSKDTTEVIGEIYNLEIKARDYLLDKWLLDKGLLN